MYHVESHLYLAPYFFTPLLISFLPSVVNLARYYYRRTVRIRGINDDIGDNSYGDRRSVASWGLSAARRLRKGRSIAGLKRTSSQTGAFLPPILRDYGSPIYQASSRTALLSALEGCVKGYESLRKAGFLRGDISVNNLMVNEEDDNPRWSFFLIDLDLGLRRRGAFTAIGVILGEQHPVMHDLESFFWVLFWICIHDNGSVQLLRDEITESLTPYYQPLVRCVNRLWRQVFPMGRPWEREDPELYSRVRPVPGEAREDPEVF
ncbi:hypothetical protein GGS23DRAFT_605898 [Durotheca rogersii]|uniref:uncharacterized protein n=1 Tax=Durotheca rogersii TaxID=419775 RepID=UPI0022212110|nr:uncharacterized protein GGS23DRAFT_605898 [Durotheca rogersii]KAI5861969.1 hypothetical protein GGS23DRAFT_605898 [Durotheca rogersii]